MSKNRVRLSITLLLAAFAFAAGDVAGIWQGTLEFGSTSLRVVFNITRAPDGTLAATMDSPDQGATGIPVSSVIFDHDQLKMDAQSIRGNFEGRLAPDDKTLDGTWQQGGSSLQLRLERVEQAPTLSRPQEPKPPYPYLEEEVQFDNRADSLKLAGTLTRPEPMQRYPAVVLITGSGPENRNEEVFGHKPFLVLADYLTRQGIAVLRCDDRGVGKSTGTYATATTADLARDAIAAVDYLKTRPDIDPKRIGLIGHSEGGLIAPIAANSSPDVAFIVMLAGPGVTGEEVLRVQARAVARAEGAPDSTLTADLALQESLFAVLRREPDSGKVAARMRVLARDVLDQIPEGDSVTLKLTQEQIERQLQTVQSAWFRYFLTYDPGPVLEKVRVPVLALNGEKDVQVDAKINLAAVEQALKAGGNTDYSVRELAGLNHLFQSSATGAVSEYARIEETMAPVALQAIGDWINAHIKKGP